MIRRVLCALKVEAFQSCFVNWLNNDFADVPVRRLEEKPEQGHGRVDSRIYIPFSVPEAFKGKSRWKSLRTIGLVVYKSIINGGEKIEIRYYISSLALGVKQFAKVVRQHWGIGMSNTLMVAENIRTGYDPHTLNSNSVSSGSCRTRVHFSHRICRDNVCIATGINLSLANVLTSDSEY